MEVKECKVREKLKRERKKSMPEQKERLEAAAKN